MMMMHGGGSGGEGNFKINADYDGNGDDQCDEDNW